MVGENIELGLLAALTPYNVMGTAPEDAFDRLTAIAAHMLQVPVALLSFLDTEREWIKSSFGTELREVPRELTFCKHMLSVERLDSMVVLDMGKDDRFLAHPFVAGAPHVKFYAGVPLVTPGGVRIGSMCAIDYNPRATFDEHELNALCELARVTMDLLEARRLAIERQAAMDRAIFADGVLAIVAGAPDRASALDSVMHELGRRQGAVGGQLFRRWPSGLALEQIGNFGLVPTVQGESETQAVHGVGLVTCVSESQSVIVSCTEPEGEFAAEPLVVASHELGISTVLSIPFSGSCQGFTIVLYFGDAAAAGAAMADEAALRRTIGPSLERKASEERLRLLGSALDTAADGIIITDVDAAGLSHRIAYVNRALCEMTGYTEAELVGWLPRMLYGPDTDEAEVARFRAEMPSGKTSASLAYYRKDGTRFSIEMGLAAVPDSTGTATHFVNIVRDVTLKLEREQRERHLLESFQLLFENNPLPMWMIDRSTLQFLKVNRAAVAFYGWSEAEFSAITLRDIRPMVEVPAIEDALQSTLPTLSDNRVWKHRRKDGSLVHMGGAMQPHPAAGENAMLAALWDLTDIVAAREDLSSSNRLLAKLADAMREKTEQLMEAQALAHLGAWSLSADRTEMTWSEEVYRLIGRERRTFPPSLQNALAVLHPEDRARFEKPEQATNAAGYRSEHEVRIIRPDGRIRYFRIESRPASRDSLDRGLFGYVQDVTERRETEQALLRSEKLAILGHLTGGVAHDFNNLLTVVTLNLEEAIAELPEDSPLQDILVPALQSAQRGSELTGQLLAYARQAPLRPQTLSLGNFFTTCRPMIRRALGKVYEPAFTIEDDRLAPMVDGAQLQTALLNLVLNARDAMPSGGRIDIRAAKVTLPSREFPPLDAKPGDYAMIEVADHGCGIAAEALPHVFEPFYTTKDAGKGSGLGLSMVDGFTRQSGGYTNIQSEAGKGTIVRLFLPLPIKPGTDAELAGTPRKLRALLVEDQPAVLGTVSRMFVQLGYDVDGVGEASAALAALDSGRRYDLLFTDIVLPGEMDGIALSKVARKVAPQMRIMLTSGFSEHDLPQSGISGAEILMKPYKRQDLFDRLTKLERPSA